MTERRAMEPFERQFADRVRAYTERATDRRIDTLEVARTAMSSQRANAWSAGLLGAGLLGRRISGLHWAVAFMAIVLIGVAGVAVLGRPSDSVWGPLPDLIRHSWQRPLPVTPGPDTYGSGFLSLASGQLEVGREPATASSSAITATGPDTLAVTATVDTIGCTVGDVGAYRWEVKGKGTFMDLTAIGTDACPAREEALAGPWVRSDLPPRVNGAITLPPGTHLTSSFDPFGDPTRSSRLSYLVPEGWLVEEDSSSVFVLHRLPDAGPGQPSTHSLVALFAQPRMAAQLENGATCEASDDAPGVGGSPDDLVRAITGRAGVISTSPATVTIGGHEGQMLDLQLAPSWTKGCRAPEGVIVGVPILHQAGSTTGPAVGLGRDHPVRLILLDLADGRTMAVVIFDLEPSQPVQFREDVARAMPIIESFEFRPPTP